MLAYFVDKFKDSKSSSLWSYYSMLRSTISTKNNVDISRYAKLMAYLKRKSVGYKAKKSKAFSKNEVVKFLVTAPDEEFLLMKGLCKKHLPDNEWFTPAMLLERQPKLKTVIDLTNTFRYYDGQEEFGTKGIDHVKILVEGRGILPTVLQLQKFFDAMDYHMEKYKDDNDALVGVHCTHGLNRTGYFVCRWMLKRMDLKPDEAIQRFNLARGYPIERQHLLDDLKRTNLLSGPLSFYPPEQPPPISNEYRSPLDDSSYEEPSRDGRYSRYRSGGRDSRREHPVNDRYYGNRDIENPYHRNRDVRDGYRRDNSYTWRRPGGDRPSRANLDTNWRARDTDQNYEGRERSFQNFGSRGNDKRRRQINNS